MEQQESRVVKSIPEKKKGATVGKVSKDRMRPKIASIDTGMMAGADVGLGSGGNFYSPTLSTDFMELPQSIDEKNSFYRHFYTNHAFVGHAIDMIPELALSKVRLSMPEAKDRDIAELSYKFCLKWSKKIGLLHRLIEILHEYFLIGEAFVFAEDPSLDPPEDVQYEIIRSIDEHGDVVEDKKKRPDADVRLAAWMRKNYRGWTKLTVLPPEQIKMEAFPFTDQRLIELVADSKTKDIINRAQSQDPRAKLIVDAMPQEIVEHLERGENIPLNTDPYAGSFCSYLARKKSQYEPRGNSLLSRCLRSLIFEDKIRQSLTSIASRHMTPYRLIMAAGASATDIEELRNQVDYSMMDPDYTIITNYDFTWEERGADQRLPDWSWVLDRTTQQLSAGLGVTENLLTGESMYSGDRIHLEVINTRMMLVREIVQDFVQDNLFKPMCARMGFIEQDEFGDDVIICPGVSFTRLALRDNQETFDALFNLYAKGSLDIDVILEMLNLDPVAVGQKLKADMFTVKDAKFNDVLGSIYSEVGRDVATNSDAAQKVALEMGLNYKKLPEGGGRFGG